MSLQQTQKFYKKVIAELLPAFNPKNSIPSRKLKTSQDVVATLRDIFPVDLQYREAFCCLYLNRANNLQGFATISLGGISGTVVDPKVVFQHGLLCNASSIILCHNHPSGNINPSTQDDYVTQRLMQVGKLLEMNILDHIILSENDYYSYSDEGRL